jgi:hypothetical protein
MFQLLPGWQDPSRGSGRFAAPPEDVKSDVMELINWCNTYNGGHLVAYRHKDSHGDQDEHAEILKALRRVKKVAHNGRAIEYADSLALMDQKYGNSWRRGHGGT